MTPKQIEAMKLALEALEYALNKPMWNRPKMTVAITAIKEALAQPEQIQPSAHSNTHQPEERNFCPRCGKRTKDIHTCTPPKEGA